MTISNTYIETLGVILKQLDNIQGTLPYITFVMGKHIDTQHYAWVIMGNTTIKSGIVTESIYVAMIDKNHLKIEYSGPSLFPIEFAFMSLRRSNIKCFLSRSNTPTGCQEVI